MTEMEYYMKKDTEKVIEFLDRYCGKVIAPFNDILDYYWSFSTHEGYGWISPNDQYTILRFDQWLMKNKLADKVYKKGEQDVMRYLIKEEEEWKRKYAF